MSSHRRPRDHADDEQGHPHRQPLGIEATGRQVSYAGIGTYGIAGGKIAEEWSNDDLFALVQQISAGPDGRPRDHELNVDRVRSNERST